GRERLEVHVAEGLVAGRQGDDVGGRVEPLHLALGPDPRHAIVDAEALRLLAVAAGVTLAGHDQPPSPISELGDGVDERAEPLPLEARPDEQAPPLAAVDPEIAARARAEPVAVVRVKAREIDAVVDHGDPLGRRPEEALDLRLAAPGDGHDVARR